MSAVVAESDFEFCPSCGTEATLNPVSGFCLSCTKAIWPNKAVCGTCGRIEERGQFRTICQYCQAERWLALYADKIEIYMATGLTFDMAIVKVQFDNRPICHCCGNKIKGGIRGRHFFCRKSTQCKSASVKYRNLQKRKNKTREEALVETISWLKERNGSNRSTMEPASGTYQLRP
jgi:hypothetical protein